MNMRKLFYIFNTIILSFTLISCDRINEPYIIGQDNPTDTGSTHGTTVLLEDFTGHYCGNCPEAHALLKQLLDKYGEKLIPISIHAGFFAGTIWDGFSTDYRTPEGEELAGYFNITDNPKGVINRTPFENETVLSPDSWDAAIAEQLKKTAPVHINISTAFEAETRELNVMAEIIVLSDIEKTLSLTVYLTEDSLVSEQLDYNAEPQVIPNYTHRHVLRASLNGTWGETISSGIIYKGDIIERNYSAILSPEFNEKQCKVIVIISETESREIIHVHENDQFFLIK